MMKEFIQVKKSFFQKVVLKEIPSGAHCVLLITGIRKSLNTKTNSKSYLLDLSDGSYTLTAFINENEKQRLRKKKKSKPLRVSSLALQEKPYQNKYNNWAQGILCIWCRHRLAKSKHHILALNREIKSMD